MKKYSIKEVRYRADFPFYLVLHKVARNVIEEYVHGEEEEEEAAVLHFGRSNSPTCHVPHDTAAKRETLKQFHLLRMRRNGHRRGMFPTDPTRQ